MECDACQDKGYFFVTQVIGLDEDDVYQEPHIERCDTCERFGTDLLARDYACQQAIAQA